MAAPQPGERVLDIDKLVNRRLPVAPPVFDEIEQVVEAMPPLEGWVAHGKTGTAFLRKADGSFQHGARLWLIGRLGGMLAT